MKIGDENRPIGIQRNHWERFSDSVAIKPSLALKTLKGMSASIVPAALNLISEFNKAYGTSTIIKKILAVIGKMANAA